MSDCYKHNTPAALLGENSILLAIATNKKYFIGSGESIFFGTNALVQTF